MTEKNILNKCCYKEKCLNETFENKNNGLYYCHIHNALHLLEELEGNILTEGKPESVETIHGYLKEAIASLEKA